MRVGVHGGISTEPNMVPMIDVLLVLIIIFMLLLGRHVIWLQLPAAAGDGQAEEALVLEVSSDGEYRINGGIVPAASLIDTLTALYADRANKLLFVRGDRDRSCPILASSTCTLTEVR